MTDILTDLSNTKLIHAIEANLSAWIPALGRLGRSSSEEPRGVNRSMVDIPSALFNSIMDAQLEQEKVDSTIQYIVSDARSRNVPLLWWVGPSTEPADLESQLEKFGFHVDDDGPGMAVDLRTMNEGVGAVLGLSIQCAGDDPSRWQLCMTMAAGFESPPGMEFIQKTWHDFLSIIELDRCRLIWPGWMESPWRPRSYSPERAWQGFMLLRPSLKRGAKGLAPGSPCMPSFRGAKWDIRPASCRLQRWEKVFIAPWVLKNIAGYAPTYFVHKGMGDTRQASRCRLFIELKARFKAGNGRQQQWA